VAEFTHEKGEARPRARAGGLHMPTLSRWEPFRDLVAMQEQMNRLFDDRFRGRDETTLSNWAPPVDVYEDAEGVTLTAELPGIDAKDVDVKVENGLLTLSGERRLDREDKKQNYHRIERTYGTFLRTFTLPPTVDVEHIKAEHKNGLLKLFLPRREETKPRKISVKVE
jgi:HSP20 family protein